MFSAVMSIGNGVILNIQKSEMKLIKLKRLSDTRWPVPIRACDAVKRQMFVLLKSLDAMFEDSNRESSMNDNSWLNIL